MPATSKSFNKEKSARFADPDEEIPSLEVAAKEEVSKEEVSKEKTPPVNYFSLYRTASRLDWVCIIIGTLGALGNGAAWPIFAIIFGEFTDTFGDATRSSSFMDDVSNIALYFLYLGIGSAVCAYLQASLWIWAGNQQANRLRQLYLRAVLKQDIPFFDTQATTGQLLQTLNDDSQQVQAAISEKAAHFLQHTSTFIVGWVVAFAKGWDMTLVMIGCLPFLAAVGASLAKMSSTTQAKAQEAYQKASSIAQQAISQARTVVAYGQEEKSIQDYDAQLEEPAKAGVRQAFFTGISLGGINTVVYCTYAVAFIYGAWRVKTGDYTGGQVLQVLVAALLGGFSLGQAAPVLETFTRGCSAGGRLFAVIERKPAISLDEEGGEAPESVRGEIELRDVHFCYPARPDVAVFTEFNLLIPAGKTVALVGESGSGKSTVVSLIERFYDPAAGAVLLDGVDLRRYNLRWLRSQVGLVSQEPTLFATNIYDNIAMGREGASQEEIEAAARAANAHEFISNLPLKYQTQVGERGLQLSGGQKQRIAIARAILKNPKILLLDEATSALDTQSERLVQEALDRMVVGRTTVVVAHRLSTVQDADIIAAVKQGRVVEQGSHEELIQNPVGMYTALVKIQMQKAEEEEERKKKGAEVEEDDEVDTSDEVVEGGAENTLEGHHSGANGIEQAAKVAALPEATTTDHVALAVTQPVGTRAAAAAAGPNSKEWWPIKRVSGEKRVSQERRRSHQLEGGPASDRALQAGADQHGPASNTQLPGVQGDYDHDAKDKDRDAKEEKPVDVPLSRLIAYNKPEWKYAVVGVVASAAAGCINPSFALIISSFIGVFYETSKSEMLQKAGFWSGMFVVIGAGSLLSTTLQQFCFGVMGQRLARRLRVMLFRAIMHQEIGWFDLEANSSGILTTRLSADASHVRGAVGDTLSLILQNIACLAFGYIVAFVFMWRMALLITGALPFMIAGASIYYKMVTGFESGADKLYGQANQAVSDAFSSVRVVQAYNLQEPVSRLYEARLGEANKTMLRRSQITGVLMAYSQFATFAVYGLIIWFGGYEVDKGHSSFEDMLKAFLAVLISALGIAQSQIGFPDAGKAKGAIQAIFPIIDRKPLIDASDPAGLQPDKVQGEIELVNIKFVYPSRKTVVVFRHFNLTIPAGKTVALVGESGSGKSTVVGLIERFYDPAEGSVLLDNIDLRQYNLRWLRSQIALVSQEPLLFSCSMLDNIRYGRPDASMEDVIEAAKAANIHSLIDKMPEKYDTQVGERGIQLSGGQKQRVAIARAVLKNPRILLLDEATSALDSQSERLVQDALDRIMVGRTSVVVAHRLSTIRNAHLIALVFRGRVLEKGTHEELMAIPNGGYAALVAAQMGSKSSRSQSLNAAAAAAAAAALPTVTP